MPTDEVSTPVRPGIPFCSLPVKKAPGAAPDIKFDLINAEFGVALERQAALLPI